MLYDITHPLREELAVWPGDVPISMERSLALADGNSVNLSAIRMSLHAGTHADAGDAHLLAISNVAAEARKQQPPQLDEYAALLEEHLQLWPAGRSSDQAHWLLGRLREHEGKMEQAIAAYQQALAIIPDAESATIALTSLQFARDDRDAAVVAIDRVFNRKPGPPDPGRLMGYGTFLHWDDARSALRSEVR